MKGILLFLLFSITFNIIFRLLDKINPQIFVPLKKLIQKWKDRFRYKWPLIIAIIVICPFIDVIFNLNYIFSVALFSFSINLLDFVYGK